MSRQQPAPAPAGAGPKDNPKQPQPKTVECSRCGRPFATFGINFGFMALSSPCHQQELQDLAEL